MTNNGGQGFKSLLAIHKLCKVSVQVLCLVFKVLYIFFTYSRQKPFIWHTHYKYFHPVYILLFHFITTFWWALLSNSDGSLLFKFSYFMVKCFLGSKKSLPNNGFLIVALTFGLGNSLFWRVMECSAAFLAFTPKMLIAPPTHENQTGLWPLQLWNSPHGGGGGTDTIWEPLVYTKGAKNILCLFALVIIHLTSPHNHVIHYFPVWPESF